MALVITGANRNDMSELVPLLDGMVVEPAPTAPPHLTLDRGYDYPDCRAAATARGYTVHIPPKTSAATPLPPPGHPDRHPPRRWVVEVAHSWFNRFRRVLTRTERQASHYLGFTHLAAILIIYRKVRPVTTTRIRRGIRRRCCRRIPLLNHLFHSLDKRRYVCHHVIEAMCNRPLVSRMPR